VFRWLPGKRDQQLYAGLSIHSGGVAGALLRALPDGGVGVERVCWFALDFGDSPLERIPAVLKRLQVGRAPLTAVMAPQSYALIQVEQPDLPASEQRDAFRWRIKDMVDFPVTDALIDSFSLPKSQRPGAPDLAYVVAAPRERVEELANCLTKNGVDLRAIDVPELALRDLVRHTGTEGRVHAYLCLEPRQALIEISSDDEVYITRQIPLAANLLDLDATEQLAQMEGLALEVQRSLDYFESQFASGSVDQLMVLSASEKAESSFIHSATAYLTVPVEALRMSEIQGRDSVDDKTFRQALMAIGAAIREMPCVA